MENLGSIGNPTFDLKVNGVSPDVAKVLLRINEVLTGEVLQLLDGGSIVLGVGKHRVPAQTHVELNVGDRIRFQVVPQGEEILLKVLPDEGRPPAPPGSFEVFQRIAGQDRPIVEVFGKLAEVLVLLSGSDPKVFASGQGAAGRPTLPLDPHVLGFLRELMQTAAVPEGPLPSVPQQAPADQPPAAPASGNPPPETADTPTVLVAPSETAPTAPASRAPSQSPQTSDLPKAVPQPSEPAHLQAATEAKVPETPAGVPSPPPPLAEKSALLPQIQEPPAESSQTTPQSLAPQESRVPSSPCPVEPQRFLTPETLASLRKALAVPHLQEKVQALAKALEQVIVREKTKPESLRHGVEEEGIPAESWLRQAVEGKVQEAPEHLAFRDFKTFLLGFERDLGVVEERLRKEGNPEVSKKVEELRAEVREAREAVESKQVQNALRQDAGEAFHFQVPFQEGGKLRNLDLFYRKRGGGRGGEAEPVSHHFLFLLEMSQLGPLRIDALVRQPQQIDLRLRFEEEEVRRFVQGKLPELSFVLHSLGFQVGFLECAAGRCREEGSEASSGLDLPVFQERRLLDLEG